MSHLWTCLFLIAKFVCKYIHQTAQIHFKIHNSPAPEGRHENFEEKAVLFCFVLFFLIYAFSFLFRMFWDFDRISYFIKILLNMRGHTPLRHSPSACIGTNMQANDPMLKDRSMPPAPNWYSASASMSMFISGTGGVAFKESWVIAYIIFFIEPLDLKGHAMRWYDWMVFI